MHSKASQTLLENLCNIFEPHPDLPVGLPVEVILIEDTLIESYEPSWFATPNFVPTEEEFEAIYQFSNNGELEEDIAAWFCEYPSSTNHDSIPSAWIGRGP